MSTVYDTLIEESRRLAEACDALSFSEPVWRVYNTYQYAWSGHEAYLRKYATGQKRILYLGMNPGPWGMVQTGVPFGEVAAVRDWLGIEAEIGKPKEEHPKRPVEGLDCKRSEVSGRRLWGLFSEIYGTAEAFFEESYVMNYCPLAFLRESGANLTPDKLRATDKKPLDAACDEHLCAVVEALQPEITVGIGGYATKCLQRMGIEGPQIGTLLHPSPASPLANRSWPELPRKQLTDLGII